MYIYPKNDGTIQLDKNRRIKYNTVMEKLAKILIRYSEDGEPVIVTSGKIAKLGNTVSLSYEDDGNEFIIGISEGVVSVSRGGDDDYSLILCEGKDYSFSIHSQYGDIPLRVVTKFVRVSERDDGLSVNLAYDLLGIEGMSQSFALFVDCIYES